MSKLIITLALADDEQSASFDLAGLGLSGELYQERDSTEAQRGHVVIDVADFEKALNADAAEVAKERDAAREQLAALQDAHNATVAELNRIAPLVEVGTADTIKPE